MKSTFQRIKNKILGSPFKSHIDQCELDEDNLFINGWVFHVEDQIVGVDVFCSGKKIGALEYGVPREDVAQYFSNNAVLNSGFSGSVVYAQVNQPITIRVYTNTNKIHIMNPDIQYIRSKFVVAPPTSDIPQNAPIEDIPKPFPEITDKIDEYLAQTRLTNVSVLNMHPHVSLRSTRQYKVFEPLFITVDAQTTYLPQSIDVILIPHEENYYNEAKRLAKQLIVKATVNLNDEVTDVELLPISHQTDSVKLPDTTIILTGDNDNIVDYLEDFMASSNAVAAKELILVSNEDHNIPGIKSASTLNEAIKIVSTELVAFVRVEGIPDDGWLASSVNTLVTDETVGVVYPKVVDLDNTLIEAGCTVMKNGNLFSFGNNAPNADAEPYQYLREIYGASAYAFVTYTELLSTHLDETFLKFPSYAGVLFSLMVRHERKLRSIYQPLSVFHISRKLENHASYALKKKIKLIIYWLDDQFYDTLPPHPLTSLQRQTVYANGVKTALICGSDYPDFDQQGGSINNYTYILHLLEEGYHVVYIAENNHVSRRYEDHLQRLGVACYVRNNANMEAIIKGLNFSIALFNSWSVASRFINLFKAWSPDTKLIINTMDLHFLRELRLSNAKNAQQNNYLIPDKIGTDFVQELNTYLQSDMLWMVSEDEKAFLSKFLPENITMSYIPLVSDMELATVPFDKRKGFLFLANYWHQPNVHSLEWFMEEVLPLLDDELLSNDPIYLVGNKLETVHHLLNHLPANVVPVGWVPTLDPYFAQCKAMISPTTSGAGVRTKIIQSMMSGLPVIATTIGAEGIGAKHQHDILIADSPEEFAVHMKHIHQDKPTWQLLHENGRKTVESKHSYEAVKKYVIDSVELVLNE